MQRQESKKIKRKTSKKCGAFTCRSSSAPIITKKIVKPEIKKREFKLIPCLW